MQAAVSVVFIPYVLRQGLFRWQGKSKPRSRRGKPGQDSFSEAPKSASETRVLTDLFNPC